MYADCPTCEDELHSIAHRLNELRIIRQHRFWTDGELAERLRLLDAERALLLRLDCRHRG